MNIWVLSIFLDTIIQYHKKCIIIRKLCRDLMMLKYDNSEKQRTIVHLLRLVVYHAIQSDITEHTNCFKNGLVKSFVFL